MRTLVCRTIEVAVASFLLLAFLPLGALIALAIVLDSRGPVFFCPWRVGQGGVRFRIFRFRTKAPISPVEGGDAGSGSRFRTTRVGSLISAWRLDEAPQLFNIIRGEMTFLGPRPESAEFFEACGEGYREILRIKPGMTGPAACTLFDEQQFLRGAMNTREAYRRDVLPLKAAADLQHLRNASLRTRAAIPLILLMQVLQAAVQPLPTLRRAGKIVADGMIVVAATLIALFIRLRPDEAIHELPVTVALLPPLVAIRLCALYWMGAYRMYWRYLTIRDLGQIARATTVGSVVFAFLLYAFNWGPGAYPRSVFVIEWLISTLAMISIRAIVLSGRCVISGRVIQSPRSERVIIFGGGDAGVALAASLLGRSENRRPVAFVDDDPRKHGALLHGIPVLGAGSDLPRLVEALSVDEIIIAIPSASGEQMRKIIFQCENLPCRLTTLPSLKEILAGQHQDRIRQVRVEDLLEREAAQVDMEAIAELLHDERILVTGAGGSIGSELCRQIVSFDPQALILLGHGENSIFEIQQELFEEFGFVARPVIADIQDRGRLVRLFGEYRPTVVIHAAAHKHVPLMELNPEEAVKNNVLGTLNLAEVAVESGVERFVMVSSDKAVNPTSVMGATKRLAEMVIQTMAREPDTPTRFTAVRFGNVLGSRGSLIPVLRRQIARGGPVTVTHPDMMRYFMTIPEAAQLMLQACALGGQAEVYVLDMGEPVRIVDLVRNLIRLSGLVPGKDIAIEYTGIRPGEKLFEEILTDTEGATATRYRQVFVARPEAPDAAALSSGIARLETAALAGDRDAILDTIHELVPSFSGGLTRVLGSSEAAAGRPDSNGACDSLDVTSPGGVRSKA